MAEKTFTIEGAITTLMAEKKYATLRDVLTTMNPSDVAAVFEELDNEAMLPLLFRLLPKELAAEAFVEMEADHQELLIRGFSDTELKELVDELYVDDAADLVEEMPSNVVKRILRQADPEMRRMINEILKYPEKSAGSIMTTEFVSLRPKMTVEEAEKRIRRTGVDKATINTCYVTDQGRLIGAISIRTLLLSDHDDVIEDIMEDNVISVNTHTDQEEVARMFSKYDFLALPVVDAESRMVGIVTFDDALDVMEDEVTEDMEIMGGMTPSDKTYLRSTVFDLFRHRIPWLMLLMVSATFTGLIISGFENALAAQVALTAFIPMLMDNGGNSGSQSSVTIIRALSLGEIEFRDLPRVIWKEIRTAVLCGVTLAAACFVKILLIDRLLLGNTEVTWLVALVVCATLALTVLVAKIVGCSLPLLAKKLGFDPAVMASPFITTIVDALSLLVYFGIASALLL